MAKYAYARVSTWDQNPDHQIDVENVFVDTISSKTITLTSCVMVARTRIMPALG
ncbi:hypothetical protein [Rhodococcus marinonascens]|uniref:hypothetical protein n=1 Tax=Rhodococcus marinonascens TaxID=38311 RepID=UPI000A8EC74E|nr:hypothetical protein [Rhodococcus marinonascens]